MEVLKLPVVIFTPHNVAHSTKLPDIVPRYPRPIINGGG